MVGISSIPLIDNEIGLKELSRIIYDAVIRQIELKDGDIIVMAHTIVSKAEGRSYDLHHFEVTDRALELARETEKDPRVVAAILSESKRVLKKNKSHLIIELNSGLICANAGVDQSNAGKDRIVLLPENPDRSAHIIREELKNLSGKNCGIIISDTQGRILREGAINIGLGFAGFKNGLLKYKGREDLYGHVLHSTEINIIDELASAAELIMGEANEGIPVVVIKGYKFETGRENSKSLIRKREDQLFK